MGKRIIISESEKKNILSLYETTTVAPPPSESILVVKKNPFKYPEYESARREYSKDLKDGDLFYVENGYDAFISKLKKTFNTEFINNLVGKKARWNDKIIEFVNSNPKPKYPMGEDPITPPNVNESKNLGGSYRGDIIGHIDIKIDDVIKPYDVSSSVSIGGNQFFLSFYLNEDHKSGSAGSSGTSGTVYVINKINSINDLYTKEYFKKVGPHNVPDEYFEIRQVKRQQTDF
jgi:hypothetical protein